MLGTWKISQRCTFFASLPRQNTRKSIYLWQKQQSEMEKPINASTENAYLVLPVCAPIPEVQRLMQNLTIFVFVSNKVREYWINGRWQKQLYILHHNKFRAFNNCGKMKLKGLEFTFWHSWSVKLLLDIVENEVELTIWLTPAAHLMFSPKANIFNFC